MAVNAVGQFLVIENVVDVLQLAKLCDAPDLYLKCMKYISNYFKAVETTEGWKVMQGHDHWLELDILQFMDDVESRRKKARKQREAETTYMVLSEAMECLEHVWTEGCTGHTTGRLTEEGSLASNSPLVKRVNGGCTRCKRMWQLLRLHSSVCDKVESCKAPLCRQLKMIKEQKKRGDNTLWTTLVKKAVSAKAVSSLPVIKSKAQEDNY
ncbi:hypothetical protein K2173_026457 [Erythroxylum novogranatense]|uniref:TAZ-type domain-containing protein n=1 Tax=Erythroxylum novogranatense TaxID=1862640 RepID=A0AAV8TWD7_9ROSI|nr:hypothetical protein K2173_026457 [Erythroxylum novogranatense]